ncbi:hypothetical protein HDV03_002323 [Kappamyces sp. JEL0829]|nr:hypothetical protein HDV03_002323 [Kappamyces sp. JEL0829]KAJ3349592.1 hypothetical protein HDU91_006367 [Kappamyces sp. JEL0680]
MSRLSSIFSLFALATLMAASPLSTEVATSSGLDPTSILTVSTMMHYSVANYCPSTDQSTNWRCPLIVSPALYFLEPKRDLLGIVHRCGDDNTYGNDQVGSFQPVSSQLDVPTAAAFYVGVNPDQKRIVVSFRGTQSVRSVIVDVLFALDPATKVNPAFKGRVHTGFAATYLLLRDKAISNAVALAKKYPSYSITFTGHSLGGAMAAMSAMDFVLGQGAAYKSRVGVITYGEPRSGDGDWAKFMLDNLAGNHFRIVHEGDIVPHLPPRSFGYSHGGRQVRLTGSWAQGMSTYKSSICDTDPTGKTGESPTCVHDIDEASLMDLLEGKDLDFTVILKAALTGLDDVVVGFLNHITNYVGFWTYPPFLLLTTSLYC